MIDLTQPEEVQRILNRIDDDRCVAGYRDGSHGKPCAATDLSYVHGYCNGRYDSRRSRYPALPGLAKAAVAAGID